MFCEWVMEGIVFEREVLMEGRDLVDDGEGDNENTMSAMISPGSLGQGSYDARRVECLHYD